MTQVTPEDERWLLEQGFAPVPGSTDSTWTKSITPHHTVAVLPSTLFPGKWVAWEVNDPEPGAFVHRGSTAAEAAGPVCVAVAVAAGASRPWLAPLPPNYAWREEDEGYVALYWKGHELHGARLHRSDPLEAFQRVMAAHGL